MWQPNQKNRTQISWLRVSPGDNSGNFLIKVVCTYTVTIHIYLNSTNKQAFIKNEFSLSIKIYQIYISTISKLPTPNFYCITISGKTANNLHYRQIKIPSFFLSPHFDFTILTLKYHMLKVTQISLAYRNPILTDRLM